MNRKTLIITTTIVLLMLTAVQSSALQEWERNGATVGIEWYDQTYGLFFNPTGQGLSTPAEIREYIKNNNQQPIVVAIHGLDSRGPANWFDSGDPFKDWLRFSFRWAWGYNNPIYVYNSFLDIRNNCATEYHNNPGHGVYLFHQLRDLIETNDIRNTEVRLIGFSWGSHIAAFSARLLTEHFRNQDRRILFTVTLADPVMSGYTDKVRDNMLYVAQNQQGVGIKSHKKLFTIIVSKEYQVWWDTLHAFTSQVLPHIALNSELYRHQCGKFGEYHVQPFAAVRKNGSRYWTNPEKSGACQRFDEIKVDISKYYYSPTANVMHTNFVIWWAWNKWTDHGMVKRWSVWRHVGHHCWWWKTEWAYRWVWTGWCQGEWEKWFSYSVWAYHGYKTNCGINQWPHCKEHREYWIPVNIYQ